MKASEMKVGDRYKIEFEVQRVSLTMGLPSAVYSRLVLNGVATDHGGYHHAEGGGTLDFVVDHVPAPVKIEAGQVWEAKDDSLITLKILFVDDVSMLVEFDEKGRYRPLSNRRYQRTRSWLEQYYTLSL